MSRPAEIVEAIVSDVLLLVYNALWSLMTLIVAPHRGARQLYRRFRRGKVFQVAPHTLFFVATFLTHFAFSATAPRILFYQADASRPVRAMRELLLEHRTPREVSQWAVSSILIVALADASLRILSRSTAGTDEARGNFVRFTMYVASAHAIYMNAIVVILVALSTLLSRSIQGMPL